MAGQEAARPLRWRYGDMDDSNFAVHGRGIPLLVGLLLLVVLFVVLCLYLRWACHRYRPDASSSSASSSPAAAAGAPSPSAAGLDASVITGLPVTLYQPAPPAAGEDAQCSICISTLVEGEKVKALPPCGHSFHPECVDAWLRSRPSCPLCRRSLLAAAKSDVGSDAVARVAA